MTPSELNPYAAPGVHKEAPKRGALGTEALAGWRAKVRAGATLVLVSELARSLLWRLLLGLSQYYSVSADPAEHLEGGRVETVRRASFTVVLLLKLVAAVGVLRGTFLLTTPAQTRRPAFSRSMRTAARTFAVAALMVHAARLFLSFAASELSFLEPLAMSLDGAAVGVCAWYAAPMFHEAGLHRWAWWSRVFGAAYVAGVVLWAAFWASWSGLIMGARHVGPFGYTAWAAAMLALGGLAFALTLRLRRVLV